MIIATFWKYFTQSMSASAGLYGLDSPHLYDFEAILQRNLKLRSQIEKRDSAASEGDNDDLIDEC